MKRDFYPTLKDYRELAWNKVSNSPGTPGMLLKAFENNVHYKLSSFDSYAGFYGHESVNELIVSRLLDILGIPHLSYKLNHALVKIDGKEYATWMCSSVNYKRSKEDRIALDSYYSMNRQDQESPLEFCIRMGWGRQISEMMLADFLVGNKDRHGANIEILLGKNGTARLSPLFDFGLSLLFSKNGEYVDDVEAFDVMNDQRANNYLGTTSLFGNLELMPEKIWIPKRTDKDEAAIMRGLGKTLPRKHLDKVWEMISRRWDYYEEVYHRAQAETE